MPATVEQLLSSALELPEPDRIRLAGAILAATEHPPCPELRGEAYIAEVRRRSAETDPSVWMSWEKAREQVHLKYGEALVPIALGFAGERG